jgi:hypothetical protein
MGTTNFKLWLMKLSAHGVLATEIAERTYNEKEGRPYKKGKISNLATGTNNFTVEWQRKIAGILNQMAEFTVGDQPYELKPEALTKPPPKELMVKRLLGDKEQPTDQGAEKPEQQVGKHIEMDATHKLAVVGLVALYDSDVIMEAMVEARNQLAKRRTKPGPQSR